ncbi:acyl carrier protein [Methyloversatilis sp. XJ19-49]|uniref:acyl carrier protein n=1 Tax=Methyloversatilis sp. XJ19-49 TaxID=2963429 RepID=UPI00211B8D82|nr:acyl carrier protein [Methyloversatilis sp. XJ19-49]MCQ9379499.1 acyl carrier protein [Methyloversatilis sp. XJ19-49]
MKTALGIAVLALTVGAWFFFERRRVDREFENTFCGRESLSNDDFYAAFYNDSGIAREIVTGVRQIIADELQFDVSRMTPVDDFSRNLRFLLDSDSMIDVALVEALEKRFEIEISDKETEDIKTVHEIITFVHGKTLSA